MAYTTKRKLISEFGEEIMGQNNNIQASDAAGMEGGAFFIGADRKQQLIELMVRMQRAKEYDFGLVPTLGEGNCIFFADVDKVPNDFDLDAFIAIVVKVFNQVMSAKVNPITAGDVITFKREDAERYHIYIPTIMISAAVRKAISGEINKCYELDIIDPKAYTIRMEGFLKWDRDSKSFKAGTRYLPIGAHQQLELNEELYNKIWLNPRGNQVGAGPKTDESSIVNDEKDDEDEELAGRPLVPRQADGNESKEASPGFNENIPEDIEDRIKTTFPEIAPVLLKYPIKKMKTKNGIGTFNLDKSVSARTCKIANKTHSKSNTYLVYYSGQKALYQKCFAPACSGKKGILLHKVAPERTECTKHDLPNASDTSIADYFAKWNKLITLEIDGKTTTWYKYDKTVGYWKTVSLSAIMRLIMGPFTDWLIEKFDAAINAQQDADNDSEYGSQAGNLARAKESVLGILSNSRSLKQLAECLRWKLEPDEPIQWNSRATYTVFPNGVLQTDKRFPEYPELYYFGPTAPEEYINDRLCVRFPYGCPPLCWDGHYITQAKAVLKDWLKLVQPVTEDLCLLLMFMALSFNTVNYKKMIINVGQSGNNSKSSTFEMLIYQLGSYGLNGDKKLITKGPKDRVSQAELDCKRMVLFEEPDPSKKTDTEFVKDCVGGSKKGTGRYNFSNKNQISYHCKVALNANTMTTVQLEKAILERLLYFAWLTRFTTVDDEVDHVARVYKADPKFKTEEYWKSVNDGMIWLLLNHFRLFEINDNKLLISARQRIRTKATLMESDLFIKWFGANWVFLRDTKANKQRFVTQDEILEEFKKLAPQEQEQIIGRRNYPAHKFIRDMITIHSAFSGCFNPKITNYRISAIERRLPAAKNKSGPNGQYQRNALMRFVTIIEAESIPASEIIPIGGCMEAAEEDENEENEENKNEENEENGENEEEKENDESADDDVIVVENLRADYLEATPGLFFLYGANDVVNDDEEQEDVDEDGDANIDRITGSVEAIYLEDNGDNDDNVDIDDNDDNVDIGDNDDNVDIGDNDADDSDKAMNEEDKDNVNDNDDDEAPKHHYNTRTRKRKLRIVHKKGSAYQNKIKRRKQ